MHLRLLALLLITLTSIAAAARDDPYRVLLLHSFRSALPINADVSDGILKGINPNADIRIEFDTENLDLSRVDDEAYIRKLIEIYQLKFRARQPDVIIATYTPALQFLLKHGPEAFPGVPVVFSGAEFPRGDRPSLPPNVTGVTTRRDFAGTFELMSRLHPDMQRIVLVAGSSRMDNQWEQAARQALQPYEKKFEFIWLRGLPSRELAEAVKALPAHSVILYLVQFTDREGAPHVPRFTVQAISTAANSPVYGLWDSLIGNGIVGGRLIKVQNNGMVAGTIARRILTGEAPASIPVVTLDENDAIFDAGQLTRWSISESRLPEGSRVLNREPSPWEKHRNAIILGGIVMTLQGLGILVLLWNRKRLRQAQVFLKDALEQRITAERTSQRLRNRMNAAEKHGSLGVLASGIAHEVNQPLIAIQNYAKAAKRYVGGGETAHQPKVNELLTEIVTEADRAGAIIRKTRELLSSGRVDAAPTAIDSIITEVLAAMHLEFESRGCRIDYDPGMPAAEVLADPLQIQLVLGNLFHNALQAMDATGQNGDRRISITVRAGTSREVEISVADRGPGIPADADEEIFDPLYTTKPDGMGVGLAASLTIIEAHGGRIWHTPNPSGGAVFHFTRPMAGTKD